MMAPKKQVTCARHVKLGSTPFSKVQNFEDHKKSLNLESIIIGVTEDNELLDVEINNRVGFFGEPDTSRGFTMSGNTVEPITLKEAKKEAFETWRGLFDDDPEQLTEMNERMGTNFRSPKSGAKFVLESDGELHGFDNSTLTDEVRYKGKDYLFRSGGGGQIGLDQKFKKLFVPKETVQHLKCLWDKYHLKKLPDGEKIPVITQDREKILQEAIKITR